MGIEAPLQPERWRIYIHLQLHPARYTNACLYITSADACTVHISNCKWLWGVGNMLGSRLVSYVCIN